MSKTKQIEQYFGIHPEDGNTSSMLLIAKQRTAWSEIIISCKGGCYLEMSEDQVKDLIIFLQESIEQ